MKVFLALGLGLAIAASAWSRCNHSAEVVPGDSASADPSLTEQCVADSTPRFHFDRLDGHMLSFIQSEVVFAGEMVRTYTGQSNNSSGDVAIGLVIVADTILKSHGIDTVQIVQPTNQCVKKLDHCRRCVIYSSGETDLTKTPVPTLRYGGSGGMTSVLGRTDVLVRDPRFDFYGGIRQRLEMWGAPSDPAGFREWLAVASTRGRRGLIAGSVASFGRLAPVDIASRVSYLNVTRRGDENPVFQIRRNHPSTGQFEVSNAPPGIYDLSVEDESGEILAQRSVVLLGGTRFVSMQTGVPEGVRVPRRWY